MTSRPLPRLSLLLAAPLLTAMLALAACSQEAPAPAAPNAQAPAATSPATTPAAADAAPAGTPAAAASNEPARTPGPIVPPTGAAPVAGTDYVEIPGGQPWQPGDGIEVVEVFGYTCPHCATFEPLVSAWAAKLPADVEFVPLAAPFGGYWMPYAKAFYTAEAMGLLDETHDAMFRAVHIDRSLPVQPLPTDEQLAQFYAQHGADPQQFISTMNSFAINAKLNRAQQFLQRSGVNSTPVLLVEGKYRVTGKSHEDNLRIAEHLIARERAASGTPAAADVPAAAEADDAGAAGDGDQG